MFSKRTIGRVSAVVILALANASCSTLQNGEIRLDPGQIMSDVLDPVLSEVGVSIWTTTPYYKNNVQPFVAQPFLQNQIALTQLVEKYKTERALSDKEKAVVLIQLGFVSYFPDQLTPQAKALVRRYYPNLQFGRRADLGSSRLAYAFNNQSAVLSDGPNMPVAYAQAQAAIPAVIIGTAAMSQAQFAAMMAAIVLYAPALYEALILGGTLSVAMIAAIQNALSQMCASGMCTQENKEQDVEDFAKPQFGRGGRGCSEQEWDSMYRTYKAICNEASGKCGVNRLSREINIALLSKKKLCLQARAHFADLCYGGKYDVGHTNYMNRLSKEISKCLQVIN